MHNRFPLQKASFFKLRLFNQKLIHPELKSIKEPVRKNPIIQIFNYQKLLKYLV